MPCAPAARSAASEYIAWAATTAVKGSAALASVPAISAPKLQPAPVTCVSRTSPPVTQMVWLPSVMKSTGPLTGAAIAAKLGLARATVSR